MDLASAQEFPRLALDAMDSHGAKLTLELSGVNSWTALV